MPSGVGRNSRRRSRASRRSVEPSHAMWTLIRMPWPMRAACLNSSAVNGLFLSSSAKGAAARTRSRSLSRKRRCRSASSLPCSLDSRLFRLFSRLSRKLILLHDTIVAMADSTRPRLTALRNGLLGLHKSLMDSERAAYERDVARITSAGQYLGLVLNDPWFQWLRDLSQFVVR